jgi:hypothetical protein
MRTKALMLLLAIAVTAQSQALPQFTSAGVVNAASYAQPISPGSIVSIFGTNLANSTATASGIPLPKELGGTSVSRSCSVIGRSQLSAGTLSLLAVSTGQAIAAQPIPTTGGVMYQQTLPNGFIAPGQYSISASGSPVVFQGVLTVSSPIQIQTSLTPGTTISASLGLVVNWTGGSGTIVKVSLVVPVGISSNFDYGYADGSSGSFTLGGMCSGNPVSDGGNGVFCSFGLPSTDNATVIVEVSPLSGTATSVSAEGLTEGVQLSWMYRYVFGGLILTN